MNNSIKMLSPFVLYCQKVIPLAFDESMSYYECLCALYSYLKDTVVPAVNNNAEALEEVQKAVVELKEYVDNYFENLDVQTEIDNKLDEMAESGELASIIAEFLELKGVLAFDTLADMKGADNLVAGSVLKTVGNVTYNDGKGALYRVRNVLVTDVIDDINIVGLTNYPQFIAELIPNSNNGTIVESISTLSSDINDDIDDINDDIKALQDYVSVDKLTLQKNIIYDSQVGGHLQGLTSNGSKIYNYRNSTANVSGEILVFDYLSMTLDNTINSVAGYHGNDMAFLNNKLYIASFKDTADFLTKIVIYDLSNNTQTEIAPFTTLGYSAIWGIAKYDDTHLLCALTNQTVAGGVDFSNDKFVLLDVTDNSVTDLTFDTSVIRTGGFYARQSIEYKDGKLYILMSLNNAVIECKLVEGVITPTKVYNLPRYDMDNIPVNEYEGIALAESNEEGTLILSSIADNPNGLPTYKFYSINPVHNLTEYYYSKIYTDSSVELSTIYVGTNSYYYEDGTDRFPYKSFARALDKAGEHKAIITFKDGGTYYASYVNNVNVKITSTTADPVTITAAYYNQSNIEIIGKANDNRNITLSAVADVQFDNCRIFARFIKFNQITALNNTELYLSECDKITNSSYIVIANRSTVKVKAITKSGTTTYDLVGNNNSIIYKDTLNVSNQDASCYIFAKGNYTP